VGDRELSRAEDGLAPDRPVTTEWGRADGRALLFWPGLNPWGELQLVEVGPLLAERGFRVISIWPPMVDEPDAYLPSRLAELIIAVADDARVDRFGFMGHSWGASIGVRLAADHPERVAALVLLDAGHTDVRAVELRDELVREFEADQAEFSFESWDAYLDWVKTNRVRQWRPSLEPRYRAGMVERDGRIVPKVSARVGAWSLYGVSVEQPSAAHARLALPVLLLVASENVDTDALARFRAAVPHAQVRTVASGHDLLEDAPAETARLAAEFLETVLASAS
jgi:pimeloyl-ACP methyl ester carboxylesterase